MPYAVPGSDPQARRTRSRRIGGGVVLGLYALASPVALAILMGLVMASDGCHSDSTEGICSASTQDLVVVLFMGGLGVGLVGALVALFGAKAPSAVWWTALVVAVVSPIVGTAVAVNLTGRPFV